MEIVKLFCVAGLRVINIQDKDGQEVYTLTNETAKPQQGITFNTEQMEECDFNNSEFSILERLCVNTHNVTHKCNLGTNEVLLTVQTDSYLPPSLGVRNDVDVCVWEPHFKDGNFVLKHVASLLALGYIQASKRQKKFITCPNDTSYSVICESSRHMFVYRQNSSITCGELKNRKSGAKIKSVAEQQVISIPNEELFGIYASTTGIYALGEDF
ncbi:hypothetical protein HHI36_008143 [Cryptolaemus montrouzieri]|uniref:Uncharacterized protein n=1 Tax=Cryptolaemus montrouzieri TaxID=559131 RepID=A0ABD2MS59_9CUCU